MIPAQLAIPQKSFLIAASSLIHQDLQPWLTIQVCDQKIIKIANLFFGCIS